MLTLVAALAAVVVAGAVQAEGATSPALPSLPNSVPGTPSAMMPRNLTCTSKLLGCMLYYQNSTTGPDDVLDEMCCPPARKVLDGEMYCLCDGLNDPALIAEIELDVKKGMGMFPRCGVKLANNVCSGSNAGGPAPKSRNGASQGTQLSYSSFLVFLLFAMWPLLP